jgi:hypothetical protein
MSQTPPAIHALAARKIIQDIEDGQHAITTSVPDDADLVARTVKASIVRLAKMYSISSSQTSFVAVDESGTQHDYRPLSSIPDNDLDPQGIPKRPMNIHALCSPPPSTGRRGEPIDAHWGHFQDTLPGMESHVICWTFSCHTSLCLTLHRPTNNAT